MFIHGDLQIVNVFVDGDELSGVLDWSESGQGDATYDLATLTLAHEEHLDLIAGYGGEVDIDVIRAHWSLRSLMSTRWLAEHGYGAPATFPEVAVLNSTADSHYHARSEGLGIPKTSTREPPGDPDYEFFGAGPRVVQRHQSPVRRAPITTVC